MQGGDARARERERERGEGEREREAKRRLVTKSTYPLYTCRHTKTHETNIWVAEVEGIELS